MKAFNLIATSLGGALAIVLAVSVLTEQFMDKNSAMMVVAPIAMIVGMSARRVTEKFLGYTLLEAMKEGDDDSGN